MKRIFVLFCMIISIIFPIESKADSVTYRVAGDSQFPPYEYVDSDGVFKGFNVDMLKAISIVTELEFEFYPMKWEDAYNSIERGQADIIQGMKQSESRKEKFLFTESLLMNSQSIFVLYSTMDIVSKENLTGKTIGLNKEDIIYYEISNIKSAKIKQYDTYEEALKALLNNEIDALIGNTLTVNYICKETNTIDLVKIVGDTLNEQQYSIAVSKEDKELLEKLNKGIEELQKTGIYDSLYRKWFGIPIKNTKTIYESVVKIAVVSSLVLLISLFIINGINNKLKLIVEEKTKEEKVLMNELRHYDKLQFMEKIISSIAHEIRNPLTSIKLYTSQMKNKIDNKEFLLAASEDIPEEIDRIDELIKEFMEYTSPKKPFIEDLNLYDEIIKAINLFKLHIRNIKLEIEINNNYYVKFDVSQFKQLVLNILINSKDAVKDVENPSIKIYAEETDREIIVSFEDNGYGMNKEDLNQIFEPFYTTKEYGNGVGMFVVKQIVNENDGSIKAQSKGEDEGMTIIINLKKGEGYEK